MRIATLSAMLVDEIFKTLGWDPHGRLRPVGDRLFARPTRWLAGQAVEVDERVGATTINDGFAVAQHLFSHAPVVEDAHLVPREGPLVIAPTHPGTVDTFAIISAIPRTDLKLISGYSPFVAALDNIVPHLIFRHEDASISRTAVVRESIRHLDSGGCLFLYPAGRLEPDPAVLPGALESIQGWHRSVDLFLRTVPQARLVPVVASHILLPRFVHHPIARSRRKVRDQQRTAEMLQILAQVARRGQHLLRPRVRFGQPYSHAELTQMHPEGAFAAIQACTADLLKAHMASF